MMIYGKWRYIYICDKCGYYSFSADCTYSPCPECACESFGKVVGRRMYRAKKRPFLLRLFLDDREYVGYELKKEDSGK